MLTDMLEGEFDMKEEEPWYDKQDLEHDLHLAAELGKNLLEQNRELEKRLQELYTTNQEQLQEIEYLSKQVDLLRSVNDQHAKVYEQLDATAQDLERQNHKLGLEKRSAQLKIKGLTETVDGLHNRIEELQRELEKIGFSEQTRSSADLDSPRSTEIQNLTCCRKCSPQKDSQHEVFSAQEQEQEAYADLQRLVHSLQAQLNTERSHREASQREALALACDLSDLEPKVALLGVYRGRLEEMEAEVQELRQLLLSKPKCSTCVLAETMLLSLEEDESLASKTESLVSSAQNGVKHRGMSLLSEMDAQYTALQDRYDSLLQDCESVNHKPETSEAVSSQCRGDDAQMPEYKTLFREIFTFIQKSKEDLREIRIKPGQVE